MQTSSNFTSDRWGIIKNWLEDNQADIILVIGIILIALIGFGLGRLSALPSDKEPVIIESQETGNLESGTGAIINNLEQGSGDGQNNPSTPAATDSLRSGSNIGVEAAAGAKGVFVASKNGTKYHWPWCSYAKNIKPENQVWFKTETEAQKAGYAACGCIAKSPPAGYKP